MFYTCGVWDGRKRARIEKNLLTCGNYNYIFLMDPVLLPWMKEEVATRM
jgi:hypothetical protein